MTTRRPEASRQTGSTNDRPPRPTLRGRPAGARPGGRRGGPRPVGRPGREATVTRRTGRPVARGAPDRRAAASPSRSPMPSSRRAGEQASAPAREPPSAGLEQARREGRPEAREAGAPPPPDPAPDRHRDRLDAAVLRPRASAWPGAVLYAYYDWRLSENEDRVGELAAASRTASRPPTRADDRQRERRAAHPPGGRPAAGLLEDDSGSPAELTGRLDAVGLVRRDARRERCGRRSARPSWSPPTTPSRLLVTSYGAVAAGDDRARPDDHRAARGEETLEAELYNWDPAHDLALLILPRGGLEPLTWADDDHVPAGRRPVWAVEGHRRQRRHAQPGHGDRPVRRRLPAHRRRSTPAFRGGPIVTGRGEVVAVASTGYPPLGYASGRRQLRRARPGRLRAHPQLLRRRPGRRRRQLGPGVVGRRHGRGQDHHALCVRDRGSGRWGTMRA